MVLGGFSLGLERTGNFKTVAFCEIDKFCTLILQKHWKGVKIYNDVKEIKKERLEADGIPSPDVITGGFPCQPFSVAGKQAGTSDDRHLWPEMFRIIQEFTPRWVVGENVKGITNIQDGMVFETVCTDLEGAGYEVRTFNIPAAGVGAPHRRERIWIVANRKESMVNPDDVRLEQHNAAEEETSWWRTSTTFEPTGSADMENARRTLRPGTELRETNEDEIERKGMPISINDQVAHPNLMWPTPTVDAATNRTTKYKQGGTSLSLAAKMWPTPTSTERSGINPKTGTGAGLSKAAKMWPTPRAALGMTFKLSQGLADLQHKKYLETEVAYVEKAPGGTLNPTWVEWLMGYPAGYTDLKDWEILSSRKSRKKSATPSSKQKEKKKRKDAPITNET